MGLLQEIFEDGETKNGIHADFLIGQPKFGGVESTWRRLQEAAWFDGDMRDWGRILDSYQRGQRVLNVMLSHQSDLAECMRHHQAIAVAIRDWGTQHPDLDPLHASRVALVEDLVDAQKIVDESRMDDREALTQSLITTHPADWQVHGEVPEPLEIEFGEAIRFVRWLATGEDLAIPITVEMGAGPSYDPPANGKPGRLLLPERVRSRAIVHLLGHHLEATLEGVGPGARSFHRWRTHDEEPIDLRSKHLTHAEGAIGYSGNFGRFFQERQAAYVGRIYPDGGTEIVSMGLEALWQDPVGFATADPTYFLFIVGILTGDLRTLA